MGISVAFVATVGAFLAPLLASPTGARSHRELVHHEGDHHHGHHPHHHGDHHGHHPAFEWGSHHHGHPGQHGMHDAPHGRPHAHTIPAYAQALQSVLELPECNMTCNDKPVVFAADSTLSAANSSVSTHLYDCMGLFKLECVTASVTEESDVAAGEVDRHPRPHPPHGHHHSPPPLNMTLLTCQGFFNVSALPDMEFLTIGNTSVQRDLFIMCEGAMHSFESSMASLPPKHEDTVGPKVLAMSAYDCGGVMKQVAVFEDGKLTAQHLTCNKRHFRASGSTVLPPNTPTHEAAHELGVAHDWILSHPPNTHQNRSGSFFSWLYSLFHSSVDSTREAEGDDEDDDSSLLSMKAAAAAVGGLRTPACASASSAAAEAEEEDEREERDEEGKGHPHHHHKHDGDRTCNGKKGWISWLFCRGALVVKMKHTWSNKSTGVAETEQGHILCKGTSYPYAHSCYGVLSAKHTTVITNTTADTCTQHVEMLVADGHSHMIGGPSHHWHGFATFVHGRSSVHSLLYHSAEPATEAQATA